MGRSDPAIRTPPAGRVSNAIGKGRTVNHDTDGREAAARPARGGAGGEPRGPSAGISVRLVLTALIWGGTFIAARRVVTDVGPFTAAFIRFLIANAVLLAFSLAVQAFRRPFRKPDPPAPAR